MTHNHTTIGPQLFQLSILTVSDPDATNGYRHLEGPYISDTAQNWTHLDPPPLPPTAIAATEHETTKRSGSGSRYRR